MSQEPEDLFSPEEEAAMQRGALSSKIHDDIAIMQQTLDAIRDNPENVGPGVREAMEEAISQYAEWMRRIGFGLEQPDVPNKEN